MLFGTESNNEEQQNEKRGMSSKLGDFTQSLQDRLSTSSLGNVNSVEDLKALASTQMQTA